jgi:hypothetical protein
MRRRGMPLVRVAATTAVVAGTAGAVSHHQQQKYANQAYAQQAQQQDVQQQAYQQGVADAQAQQQQYAPPPPPPPAAAPAAPGNDLTAQLQQLAQLHNAGVLSDEEFAAAKQKLLAG